MASLGASVVITLGCGEVAVRAIASGAIFAAVDLFDLSD